MGFISSNRCSISFEHVDMNYVGNILKYKPFKMAQREKNYCFPQIISAIPADCRGMEQSASYRMVGGLTPPKFIQKCKCTRGIIKSHSCSSSVLLGVKGNVVKNSNNKSF